jgi:hypothetical protein
MITPPIRGPVPELPRPGQHVYWRDQRRAQAWHWEEIFGPGPFEVVRTVDKSAKGLAAGVIVRTLIGEREISEIWLTPADEPAATVLVEQ